MEVNLLAIFVLGDPHLSFSADKPMDVFGLRWQNHHKKISKSWQEQVTRADTVVLAGDLSWAISLAEAEADLQFFHDLPGKKVLLKGNHDYWWETAAKMNRFFAEHKWDDFSILYNNAVAADGVYLCGTRGWEPEAAGEQDAKILAREVQRLELSLKAAPPQSQKIVFFHYPPFGGGKEPFKEVLQRFGVRYCYYGHIHGPAARETQPVQCDGITYTLVSADALDFCPLKIEPKEQKMDKSNQNNQKRGSFWAKLLSQFKSKC